MKFPSLRKKADKTSAKAEKIASPPVVEKSGAVGSQPRSRDGVLLARGLMKTYSKRTVVNGASLGVRRGESVGLLGPNGAGKTTFARDYLTSEMKGLRFTKCR